MGTNVHGDLACAEGQLGAQVQLKDEGRSRLASLCFSPAAMLELTAAPGRLLQPCWSLPLPLDAREASLREWQLATGAGQQRSEGLCVW